MTQLLKKFLEDQSGATAIEYGLIATLIGVAVISGAGAAAGSIDSLFKSTDSELVQAFGEPE